MCPKSHLKIRLNFSISLFLPSLNISSCPFKPGCVFLSDRKLEKKKKITISPSSMQLSRYTTHTRVASNSLLGLMQTVNQQDGIFKGTLQWCFSSYTWNQLEGNNTWLLLENSFFTEFKHTAYLLPGLVVSFGKQEFCALFIDSLQPV